MKSKLPLLCALTMLLSSCQTPLSRGPASSEDRKWDEYRLLVQRKVELQAEQLHLEKKKRFEEIEKVKKALSEVNEQLQSLEGQIGTMGADSGRFVHSRSQWRQEEELLELADMSLYELDKKVKRSFSTYEAKATVIKLSHNFISTSGYKHFDHDRAKPRVNFTIKCDAPFAVKYGLMKNQIRAGQSYSFSLGDKKQDNDATTLIMNEGVNSCDVRFISDLEEDKVRGLTLENETRKLNVLEPILATTEKCSLLRNSDSFIDATFFPNMTCPEKFESIQLLPEPEDSLHARVISLLGQDLPKDFVKKANPFAPLDFSKAPKFDSILVSYLVFRADFYGTLLGRLLAHHADKGALVRIVVSDVISLKKDEAMYEKLMAEHPNLKVIKYKFDDAQGGGAKFSQLHRTNHVKLFIAYSKDEPSQSMAIVGGRNIHDGFVFKTPVDVGAFPQVVNYVSGDESWAYWRDFEMVIRGQDFIESLIRQYMSFYHINKDNLVMKVSSVAVASDAAVVTEKQTMRHMVSIPFKDDPNLNLFYAKMIDTAKKKILISSPYFRPVKEIGEALDRAIERGVDITIITRLDLEGDTADFILGAVNKDGVNRYLKKVKVYEYTEPKVILHSKLLMIDDETSFISSVNLNKRSFYHDLENGVVVNDRDFTLKMSALYKDYLKLCQPLTEKQEIIFWKKWLIKIFDKVF